MTPHQKLVESVRKGRQPVYLVTGLYVVIGFALGVFGALTGDLLASFLGFFFINGAVVGALCVHSVSRIAVRVSSIEESLDRLFLAISRIDGALVRETQPLPDPVMRDEVVLDLADIGNGNPSQLAAAVLQQNAFPRLAPLDDSTIPATMDAAAEAHNGPAFSNDADPSTIVATKNLLRVWRIARHDGNLAACRTVHSALLETLDSETLDHYSSELQDVERNTRARLRTDFAKYVREARFADAITVGEQIVDFFPDEPVAHDFERLRPILKRRMKEGDLEKSPLEPVGDNASPPTMETTGARSEFSSKS